MEMLVFQQLFTFFKACCSISEHPCSTIFQTNEATAFPQTEKISVHVSFRKMGPQSLAFPQTDIQNLPIFNGGRASFVFLCEQEPDELGVGHFALGLSRTPGYGPGKDPVNHPGRDGWKRIGKTGQLSG
jgi:hypothetical protein